MTDYENIYCNENEYPDLDVEGASKRLSVALSCCTVNNGGDNNNAEFARLIEHIVLSFPTVAASSTTEVVGRSLLIHIKGSNPNLKPGLFMSHLDVVGVEAGTENQWEYPPFSGAIAEGYIWGRGALDIKNQVFAELEAAEYLLSHGRTPEREMYLAFGEDEETFQTGAHSIAKLLESRGVELEFLLDEGGGSYENGSAYCAPNVRVAYIDLAEKGYADLKVKAKGQGGHSSNPFGGSSMEVLARAIAAICDTKEAVAMPKALAQSLKAIAPYVTEEPLKSLIGDIEGNSEAIMDYCASLKPLFPLTATTIAPTMISGGGPACNVLPQDMEANINFRLIPGDSVDALTERCTKAVEGLGVELEYDQANNPSILSEASGVGYESILAAMEHYYKNVVFVPTISAGSTDARQYECVCKACVRCAPYLVDNDEIQGRVHGTNERISQRSYIQGIRVMIRMMETSCGF
jgi:carboxypeptidase PM20D1